MANHQQPSSRGPRWAATIGGTTGITALILQDHPIAWVILAGFIAWLIHDVIIAWISRRPGSGA
jgi:hypothetical protein